MNALIVAIYAWLLAATPHRTDLDEPKEAREARLATIAFVIATASEGVPERAALLMAQGESESRWARYVGEGRCKEGPPGERCDPDYRGFPRARTYWQTWRVSCPKAWDEEAGSVLEMTEAAKCTVRLMRSGMRRCQLNGYDPLHGAFAGARGGAACTGPWAVKRTKRYRAALSFLWRNK